MPVTSQARRARALHSNVRTHTPPKVHTQRSENIETLFTYVCVYTRVCMCVCNIKYINLLVNKSRYNILITEARVRHLGYIKLCLPLPPTMAKAMENDFFKQMGSLIFYVIMNIFIIS